MAVNGRPECSPPEGAPPTLEALREALWLAQSTIDALPTQLCVLDEQGEILLANHTWRDFARTNELASEQAAVGQNYLQTCDAVTGLEREDAVLFAAGIRAVLRGELREFRLEYPCHSPVEQRWFVGRVTRFVGGGPPRLVVSHQNITQRKLAEAAMQRLAALVESSDDAIIGKDLKGMVTSWNRGAEKIFGYTAAEMVGASLRRLVPLERQAEVEWILGKIRNGESVKHFETQRLTKDGRLIEVCVTASPTRHANGEIFGVSKVVRDITEQKQTEKDLQIFRALVDQSQDIFEVVDPVTGRFLDVNDRGLQTLGYTREEFLALRTFDIDSTMIEEAWPHIAAKVQELGVMSRGDIFRKRKDGTTFPIEIKASWVKLDRDYIVTAVRDMTESKRLEQQFLRAQRMESIGTLAGGIAHDLNNALSPIIMSLDLLQMRFSDPESQELLSIINASAHHGAEMVRQVLSFARGMEGHRMEVALKDLIREIEKIANDTFLKHIEVRTKVPHDLWTVWGDPTQLHQVLLNLCMNARDALPDGGRLTITGENVTLDAHYAGLEAEAKPGPYVCLRVADTGTGMSAAVQEKMFDPFYTTKEVGKGTGLGLSTTLGIVKSHDGFLRVKSELGKGTVFQIYLPAQGTLAESREVAPAVDLPPGRGELIMVVDDEASVRQITQQTLQSFNYRVLLAGDGVEAVTAYAVHRSEIAVVITDVTMPVMDGLATIQVLRKMNPEVRIIAASGLSNEIQMAQAASFGVKHFLPKPYSAEILLQALKEVLSET